MDNKLYFELMIKLYIQKKEERILPNTKPFITDNLFFNNLSLK